MTGKGVADAVKRAISYPEEVKALIATELERLAKPGSKLRILDVGCGTTSELARFNERAARRSCHLIGLDVHGPTIEWCRAHGFHDEYICADASDAASLPEVDVIVGTDLVEHFEKPTALKLVAQFEQKARLAVVLLTPNGYIYNPFTPDNPYMEHKCGFTTSDFEALGFTCRGLGGPRWLRTAGSMPRGPKAVSLPLLAVLSRMMRPLPSRSFHLLAHKITGRSTATAPRG